MKKSHSAEAQRREEEIQGAKVTEPEKPQCPTCGGARLKRHGTARGRQRYQCHDCGRQSYGVPDPPKDEWRPACRFCGGWAKVKGYPAGSKPGPRRRRYLQCTQCKRCFTDVYVRAAPVMAADGEGKLVRAITFNLDIAATKALVAYCQRYQMGQVRAVREILRKVGREPVKVVTVGRREREVPGAEWGPPSLRSRPVSGRTVFAPRILTNEEARTLVLPSMRAERARARLSRRICDRYAPTVYVQARVRVCLDAVAVTGLWRAMCERGVDHQTAARRLVAEAL